jgi:hypothetical protein
MISIIPSALYPKMKLENITPNSPCRLELRDEFHFSLRSTVPWPPAGWSAAAKILSHCNLCHGVHDYLSPTSVTSDNHHVVATPEPENHDP